MKKYLVSFAVFFSMLIAAPAALAITVDVSGNGAGSNNSTTVNQNNSSTTNQNNQADTSNQVNVDCNTGGNSASQNTGSGVSTNTGDCSANVKITNKANTNNADVSCKTCPKPSPTPDAVSQQPGQVGGPGGGANGGGGGANGGGGSSSDPQVLAKAGILEDSLMYVLGFASLGLGLWQMSKLILRTR